MAGNQLQRAVLEGEVSLSEAQQVVIAEVLADGQLCEWFALCVREAVTTRPHPVLGDVPICKECNDKMDRLSQ